MEPRYHGVPLALPFQHYQPAIVPFEQRDCAELYTLQEVYVCLDMEQTIGHTPLHVGMWPMPPFPPFSVNLDWRFMVQRSAAH